MTLLPAFPRRRAALAAGTLALLLAGCSALPNKPSRPVLYDFGPGADMTSSVLPSQLAQLPPIALADIETPGVADTAAVTYRLQYADARQLRPYALARWTLPPAQLVRQRVREHLAQRRPVLDADDLLAQKRIEGSQPRILRLQLEEFSQVFASASASDGVIRLRATLVENTPQGEQFVGQRVFVLRRPAASADATGGVAALAAATDAAAEDIESWLAQAGH